ncbi:MAG: DNA repair protein RadA [Bacilli bacterium]
MAKIKTKYVCQSCSYEAPKWLGKCPTCNEWNTMVEEISKKDDRKVFQTGATSGNRPVSLQNIEAKEESRIKSSMEELNRALGGGIVPGSMVLIGGDPGIGKSTLLLQTANDIVQRGESVLYVSGEESPRQIKLRAERLGISTGLFVLAETDMAQINYHINEVKPGLVIIDSIQTVYMSEITSAPGSVSQVRECTSQLMRIAKGDGISIFIVGHVTKDGNIAGPRVLEHMVDTVLYFEGEQHHTYRILRAVKNRFGSTNEMGIFEMQERGLVEVTNPSEVFLEERPLGVAGSVVVAAIEGTRPVLVEIQALITPTSFGHAKRMATGIDYNRMSLLMAVLEKRAGLLLQNYDAFVKVSGGLRLDEPAVDLSVALSIASSFKDMPTVGKMAAVGEVGLTGEIRRVNRIEQRIQEAKKLGFEKIIIPHKNVGGYTAPKDIEVIAVRTIADALRVAFA